MTACGAALRRLGTDAASLEQVADRLVRHLYKSLTMGHLGEPACSLVRLFKTTPYSRLTPDLRALADTRLGNTPPAPSLTCLTLLASAGAVPGWNDPARSSRFRVIPLDTLEAVERLPMFSQLFRQLGVSLPSLTQPGPSVLLDQHEQSFNVFHIPEAEGSPYVPGQEEFVRTYGIRSVLGFGAPLPDGELFSIILFSKDFIPESTATLSNPSRCARRLHWRPMRPRRRPLTRTRPPGRSRPATTQRPSTTRICRPGSPTSNAFSPYMNRLWTSKPIGWT
jgi:two-component system sensor histidine kinase/response regulator